MNIGRMGSCSITGEMAMLLFLTEIAFYMFGSWGGCKRHDDTKKEEEENGEEWERNIHRKEREDNTMPRQKDEAG